MTRASALRDGTVKLNPIRSREKRGKIDFPLLVITTILAVFGLVMVFSASYYNSINDDGTPFAYLWRQGFFLVSGFVLMFICSEINYRVWTRFGYLSAIICVVLLGLVLTPLGVTRGGATRWLYLRVGGVGFTIMPGELAKLFLIIVCASYFARDMRRARSLTGLLPVMVYTVFITLLIIKQPNLSTAITVMIIGVGIAFLAGMHWGYILALVGVAVAGVYYLMFINTGYWHERMVSFRDPFADALGDGYQVVQGLLALGSGGVHGKGLGQSVQKNLYLPDPQNDFILAVIGEELGFIGILCLMIAYALLIWRIFYISIKSKENFGMLLGSGVAIMIGAQVILNVAVVTSSMPPTGIALPFVSYGGNSLWIFMILVGIVLNISRYSDSGEEEA